MPFSELQLDNILSPPYPIYLRFATKRTNIHVPPLAQSRGSPLRVCLARRPSGGAVRPSPLAPHRHPRHHRGHLLPLRLADRDAQRRPPPPPRRHPRDPILPRPRPRAGLPLHLRTI